MPGQVLETDVVGVQLLHLFQRLRLIALAHEFLDNSVEDLCCEAVEFLRTGPLYFAYDVR